MLVGFKRQFAPFVEEGSKTHTIRARRQDGTRAKVGETLHCYVDSRQKTMRLLGRFECVKVQSIHIVTDCSLNHPPLMVQIDDTWLTADEAEVFFHADGFRAPDSSSIEQAAKYWKGREFPFDGDLNHWKFEEGTK